MDISTKMFHFRQQIFDKAQNNELISDTNNNNNNNLKKKKKNT